MLKLGSEQPGAAVLWPEDTRPLRIHLSDTSTPLLQNGLVLAHTSKGHVMGREAATANNFGRRNRCPLQKAGRAST
jgi:hypothetical protein